MYQRFSVMALVLRLSAAAQAAAEVARDVLKAMAAPASKAIFVKAGVV